MKKIILAAVVLTLGLFAPVTSQASHVSSECSGTVQLFVSGGAGSCSVSFPLSDARFVSLADTHGNFHAPAARGELTLTWSDQRGNIVAQFACFGLGLPGDGSLDLASNCSRFGPGRDTYVVGTQTLTVTASATYCGPNTARCVFHGRLSLSAAGDVI